MGLEDRDYMRRSREDKAVKEYEEHYGGRGSGGKPGPVTKIITIAMIILLLTIFMGTCRP